MFPVDLAIFVPLDCRCAQCSQVWTNGWPVAASLWAISSSWCGKIRSTPPVWMSNDGPRWAMLIAEHSMCQPGRPSPIAVDHDGSPGLGALPQREVADVVLGVLVGLDPLADPQLLGIEPRQPAVGRPRRDPEEDRAVVGPVGVAALEQRPDERDHLVDVLGGAGQDVGPGHPQRVGVGQEAARGSGSRARRCPMPAAAAPRMILSSISVMFMTQRTVWPRQRRWRTSRSANRNDRKLPMCAGPYTVGPHE